MFHGFSSSHSCQQTRKRSALQAPPPGHERGLGQAMCMAEVNSSEMGIRGSLGPLRPKVSDLETAGVNRTTLT